jgi:hypothetical protein
LLHKFIKSNKDATSPTYEKIRAYLTNLDGPSLLFTILKPRVEFLRTFPCENTVETSEKESFLGAEFSAHPQDAEDTPLQPLAYRQARQ